MRLMLCLHRHFAQLGWPVASAATLTAFCLSQQEKTAAGNFYRFLDGNTTSTASDSTQLERHGELSFDVTVCALIILTWGQKIKALSRPTASQQAPGSSVVRQPRNLEE